MTTELERFQSIKSRVDSYNTQVLEKELKVKQYTEELDKLLVNLKELGYNSLEEAISSYESMSKQINETLDRMEKTLNGN